MVSVRRGKTTSNNVRSCDTVRAGAFFPPGQLQVPQKAMRQHRRQPMVGPAGVLAHCIMGHPELRFAFFHAWLDGPAHATEPDKGAPGRARRRLTDRGGIHRVRPQRPLDPEPDRTLWQPLLTEGHAVAGKGLHHGPLGPLPRPCADTSRRRAGAPPPRPRYGGHARGQPPPAASGLPP